MAALKRTELRRSKGLERQRKPIRPVSRRRERVQRDRRKLVTAELSRRPWCEIRWDDNCRGRSVTLHEPDTRARGGDILDVANTKSTCGWCHDQVHANPAEATARGFLIPSWEG